MRWCLALLVTTLAVAGEALAPSAWAERLRAIDARLAAGDDAGAQKLAKDLDGIAVAWPDGPGAADPGLPAAIRRGDGRRRISESLATVTADATTASVPDAARLGILDASRRSRVLAAGGVVGGFKEIEIPEVGWLTSIRETIAGWVEAALDWLRRLFTSSKPGEGGGLGAVWAWVAAGLGLALVAAVAVAALRRRPPPDAPAPMAATGADEALALPSASWFAESARLLAAGDPRSAVRAAYLGLLAATWERGLLHHRSGWTNWDYVRAAPPAWSDREAFVELTRRFDRVWYGSCVDQPGPEEFRQRAHAIVSGLQQAKPR